MASTRCQQSSEIVSGLCSEKWESKTTLNEWTLQCPRAFSCARLRARLSCLPFILTTLLSGWNIIYYNSTNFTDTIGFLVCLLWLRMSLWITEQNAWTKRRFLDMKRDFIKQNKHLLSKWMSSECNHMKIIKGKWLIWSLFLTCVTLLLGWLLFVMICLLGAVLG